MVSANWREKKVRYRGNYRRCSVRKGILKIFTKFTGKRLCQSLFSNEIAGLRSAIILKKRLWHRCFPANFLKLLRTPFYSIPLGDCFCKQTSLCRKQCLLNRVSANYLYTFQKVFYESMTRIVHSLELSAFQIFR